MTGYKAPNACASLLSAAFCSLFLRYVKKITRLPWMLNQPLIGTSDRVPVKKVLLKADVSVPLHLCHHEAKKPR